MRSKTIRRMAAPTTITACLFSISMASGTPSDQGQTLYTQPGLASFDPNQTFRSVGPFGSFGKGSEIQERDHVGLLTFTLRKTAPESTLVWANLVDGKDFVLGSAVFPGKLESKRFEFVDWTTSKLLVSNQVNDRIENSTVYFSRSFPAVLYETQASEWSWKPGDLHADWAAYRDRDGHVKVIPANSDFGTLGAPWILLWPKPGPGAEVAPLLVRFEKRPASLRLTDKLVAKFSGEAGCIAVMPLYGVRRFSGTAAETWKGRFPTDALSQAERWVKLTAAFPIGLTETFGLDESKRTVRIQDKVSYKLLHDDWGTRPEEATPVSPVTALAQARGYPVKWFGAKVERPGLATLLGPYAFAKGSEFSYEIPVPSARDNALAPIQVVGDSSRQGASRALNLLARNRPIKPDDTSDGGLNLQLKEYSQSYRLFDDTTKSVLGPQMAAAFDASYAPENLQTVTDPITGARYLMCNKIWCAGEAYDREWYAGRQLDAAAEYSAWVDPNAVASHWKAVQGLYAYYRIYNDWSWSGTLSSLFAYALCADGMNFAMEGMLGVARMAKQQGDLELWRDASYRSAKQALCTFGSWFLSDWEKNVDYVTWTDTSYDYAAKRGRYVIKRMAPSEVQTGFGLDIFSDTTGIKVFRPGSYWHATAAVYWNNMSLDRLYLEYLYGKIRRWEFVTLPTLHPQWTDGKAIETFSNQPYASNFVLTHLDARAVLFGTPPDDLAALTTKLQPDVAFLYRLRSAQDLVQSGVPQVWLPTGDVRVTSTVWDSTEKTVSVIGKATHAGRITFDWRLPGTGETPNVPNPGPRPSEVLFNGKPQTAATIAGGFWRSTVSVKADEEIRIAIRYR